jgi:hypothetical protein
MQGQEVDLQINFFDKCFHSVVEEVVIDENDQPNLVGVSINIQPNFGEVVDT